MNYKSKNRKASFGLITAPFLVFLGVVIALPLIAYLYQDRFFLTSLHKDLLWGSIYDKRTRVQGLLDEKMATLESISKSAELKANIELIGTDTTNIKSRREARALEDKRREALNQLRGIVLSRIGTGQFGLLSLISRDGHIIVSSSEDLVGTSIADTELFKNRIAKASRPVVIGPLKDPKRGHEFYMTSPVLDGEGNVRAYLYGTMNLTTLAPVLKGGTKGPVVFELIDRQGNILLSTEEIGSRRYNPALLNIDNQLHYYDGLFINMTPIDHTELILLQRAQAIQSLYPLIEATVIYISLTLLVLSILLYQSLYLRRRVSEPLAKVFAAIRAASAGLRPIFPQKKGYPMEVDNLVKAVQQLITDFVLNKDKASGVQDNNPEPTSGTTSLRQDSLETVEPEPATEPVISPIPNETFRMIEPVVEHKTADTNSPIISFLRDTTDGLRASLKRSLSAIADEYEFHSLRQDALLLSCVVDNYSFINSYEGKVIGGEKQEFPMQEAFDELSRHLQGLGGLGHIETVRDFDHSIGALRVKTDKRLLLRVMLNLIYNAFASTNEGTITVVSSHDDSEDGTIRIHISDTGPGYEEAEIKAIKAGLSNSAPALTLAFMLAGLVGLNLSVESIKGKGSVYTLSISIAYSPKTHIE